MGNLPFLAFMLLSIPDNLLLFYLGLALTGLPRPPLRMLLAAALVNALFSFVVRNLPMPAGVHLLFQVPFQIVSLIVICKFKPIDSALTTFLGLILLVLIETLMEILTTSLTNISFQTFMNNPKLHLILAVPDFTACLLVVMALNKWRIVPFNYRALIDRRE